MNTLLEQGLIYSHPAPRWWQFWRAKPRCVGSYARVGDIVTLSVRAYNGPRAADWVNMTGTFKVTQ